MSRFQIAVKVKNIKPPDEPVKIRAKLDRKGLPHRAFVLGMEPEKDPRKGSPPSKGGMFPKAPTGRGEMKKKW